MCRRCYLWSILVACLCFGCQRPHITVDSRLLGCDRYASYWVHTPDPQLLRPEVGRELVICWRFPQSYFREKLELLLTVRFQDGNTDRVLIRLKSQTGAYVYQLIGEAACRHGDIKTYKVEAFTGGCLREKWRHQLWCERIEFPNYGDEFSRLSDEKK
ncbi:MAG: hypothetical protein KDK40_01760 [Chlamydiia bacterium]|nr:hypothetical protein [Chlamydiia bacterium]